jgi:hypothetical protein
MGPKMISNIFWMRKTPQTPISIRGAWRDRTIRKHRRRALSGYMVNIIRFWGQWESLWYEVGAKYWGSLYGHEKASIISTGVEKSQTGH